MASVEFTGNAPIRANYRQEDSRSDNGDVIGKRSLEIAGSKLRLR